MTEPGLWIHAMVGLADSRLTAVDCAKAVLKLNGLRTDVPCGVIEAALAHVPGDKMNVTYQRGDLFDKRRKLVVSRGRLLHRFERRKDRVIQR